MDTRLADRLKKTKYFADNNIEILDIERISDNDYKIITKDKDYELCLHDTDDQLDLYSEINHKKLKDLGLSPKHTYELGLFADISKTYTIREYRKEVSLGEFLENHDKNSNYKLGYSFGKVLKKIHQQPTHADTNWYSIFNTKANYLFYIHGVGEIGDSDYIIIDYINGHKHLAKNVKTSYLYQNLDDNHIFISEDGSFNLEGLGFNMLGDPAYDFTQVNRLAIISEEFAKGTLDGYFAGNKIPIKFFRLLSLYQAYEVLEATVNIRNEKEHRISKTEIEKLIDMYDNFNQDVPNWT